MGKVTTACNPCAVRKIKCTGIKPCPACQKSGFDCTFSTHSKRGPKGPRPATRARIDKSLQLQHPSPVQQCEIQLMGEFPDHTSTTYHQHSPSYGPLRIDGTGNVAVGRSSFGSERDSGYATSNSAVVPAPSCIIVGDSDVSLEEVAAYMHLYQTLLYPVWPVVDQAALLKQLQHEPRDPENCTLAFALCAAVTARLRIDNPQDAPNTSPELAISKRFGELAESHRSMYSYRSKASIPSILIPFFLHVHYDCQCRVFMDSMLLREAITVAQLMNLDKTSGYTEDISLQDRAHRYKIFWLLFISEKGCAMMRDFPTSLQPGLPLPDPNFEQNPALILAFIALVKLFTAVNDVFGGGNVLAGGRFTAPASAEHYTNAFFVQLQDVLGQRPDVGPQTHDAQKADILLTQQWLQVLVWRFSVSRVDMSTKIRAKALSFGFPAEVAKHTMATLRLLPFEAIVAHGRGMEQKIFEIASTLLDVINVVPGESCSGSSNPHGNVHSATFDATGSLPTPDHTGITIDSPRGIFGSLSGHGETPLSLLQSLNSILSIIGGRHSPYVALLQKKITETRVLINPAHNISGPVATSPAPSSVETADDAERYRTFWDAARRDMSDVTWYISTPTTSEAGGSNWSATGHPGLVQANPMAHLPPLSQRHERPVRPLHRSNSHWPIGTEMLGTISDPKYLDGWRGVHGRHSFHGTIGVP